MFLRNKDIVPKQRVAIQRSRGRLLGSVVIHRLAFRRNAWWVAVVIDTLAFRRNAWWVAVVIHTLVFSRNAWWVAVVIDRNSVP